MRCSKKHYYDYRICCLPGSDHYWTKKYLSLRSCDGTCWTCWAADSFVRIQPQI